MNIESLLQEYNIKYLTHFTSIYNLESILKNGIMPINTLKKNNINYYNTDEQRLDNQLDMISISNNKINNRMLYKNKIRNTKPLNIWCILILETKLLNENINFYYCKTNAASSEIRNILKTNKENLKTIESKKKYFESTDDQKEILVEGIIYTKYIKGIIVENINEVDIVKVILKSNNMKIPVNINKSMFGKEITNV